MAVVALAFAACGHSNSSPTPVSTVTPVPTGSASASASATPCALSLGIAYEPDGGNGGSFNGIQYTHFEDNNENLCPAADTSPQPRVVTFSSSVGGVAFSDDVTDAIALLYNPTSGGYSLAQDIFGATVGSLTPVGFPYDLSIQPTPAATGVNTASPLPTTTPVSAPLIADAQSASILGGSSSAVALTLGTPVSGSANAIVALTSLTNAPPQYGNAVPFSGSSYTLQNIPNYPRNIVRVETDSSGTSIALVRGPDDLISFGLGVVATGYRFNAKAEDATLGFGSGPTLRGSGAMALDPANAGRALIGGTTAGGANTLTLVTGLPDAITRTSTLTLPGTTIRSIVISTAGVYALVATDVGIVSVGGVDTAALSIVKPFAVSPSASSASAPTYTTCLGTSARLTNIYSIGISADQRFLVALGSASGVSCPSGYNASLVAVGYDPSTGQTPSPAPISTSTATPGPTMFVQNNVVAPPTGADLMYVH
jgi:hypothetical protein